MKRICAWALALCLLVGCAVCFVGCDQENAGNDADSNKKQTFTVGFDAEFPPYGYMDDDGSYTGFDLELAEAVCKINGWELVKKPIQWNAKDGLLNNGNIDCIWNGFTIDGREDDYTWTEPYVDNSQVVVVKKDSGIKTLADLSGKVVAVQKASSALEAISDVENAAMVSLKASLKELKEVPEYNTAFLNLQQGSVDAIAMDIGVAKFQIESRGDAFMMLDEKLASEKYGIGFKKGNTELRDQVWTALQKVAEDGTFMELAKKYKIEDSVLLGK